MTENRCGTPPLCRSHLHSGLVCLLMQIDLVFLEIYCVISPRIASKGVHSLTNDENRDLAMSHQYWMRGALHLQPFVISGFGTSNHL